MWLLRRARAALAHVLDRVTFGARPGDIARVKQIGVTKYIDLQLHPERIDDRALEARLDEFETLDLSTREIAERYAIPAQQARRALKRQQVAQGGGTPPDPRSRVNPQGPEPGARPEELRNERQVLVELTEQKLLRAVYSDRQLQEVLVDFWFNHFNVFAGKGADRLLLTSYERDVIRPNVLGTFRDLLGATAQSPAMLFYLDNWLSVDPNAAKNLADGQRGTARRRRQFGFARPNRQGAPNDPTAPAPPGNIRRTGLNENYARELMELHTLGVDGGYTQQDIVQVARVFTGWTIADPRRGAEFRFDARLHDNGEKVVLGRKIKGEGQKEGEQVLDILARHPSTARFLSTKLARRFVSDDPPPSLVDRASRRFQETGGDLREVVRTILSSPEFFATEAYRAKVKSPFEFVTSAVRATGADVRRAGILGRALQQLGMPLYMSQPPTGYADRADAWVNTGALVNRMNFSVALASNTLQGVSVDLGRTSAGGDISAARDRLVHQWLRGDVSRATLETMTKASDVTELAALTIGSPEFQRR